MTTITDKTNINKPLELTQRCLKPVAHHDQKGFQQALDKLNKMSNKLTQTPSKLSKKNNRETKQEDSFLSVMKKGHFEFPKSTENQKKEKEALHLLPSEKHQHSEALPQIMESYSANEPLRKLQIDLGTQEIKASIHNHTVEKITNPVIQATIDQLRHKIQQLEPANKEARLILSGKLSGTEIVIHNDGGRLSLDISGIEKQLLILKDNRHVLQQRLQHCCPDQTVLLNFSSKDSDHQEQRSKQYHDAVNAWLAGGEDAL